MSAYRVPADVPDYPDEYWVPCFDSPSILWRHVVVRRKVKETTLKLSPSAERGLMLRPK